MWARELHLTGPACVAPQDAFRYMLRHTFQRIQSEVRSAGFCRPRGSQAVRSQVSNQYQENVLPASEDLGSPAASPTWRHLDEGSDARCSAWSHRPSLSKAMDPELVGVNLLLDSHAPAVHAAVKEVEIENVSECSQARHYAASRPDKTDSRTSLEWPLRSDAASKPSWAR